MTKEELIALSDLNREDNIKYISSEAQGIAITLDSDRYAPTFCKLERAYICGRRKSEEQIAELEAQIEKMKCCANCRFGYCERSSERIDKDGNRTFHCWNEEKEKYCDVGKNAKYQCWEIKENEKRL